MKYKKNIAFLIISITLFSFAFSVKALNLKDAFGNPDSSTPSPVEWTAESAGYDATKTDVVSVISKVISSLLGLLGVIFLVLTIYGGFLWMTARGNEQQVEKARETIVMAIIGIIIVLVAYSISYYVVYYLTEGTLKSA